MVKVARCSLSFCTLHPTCRKRNLHFGHARPSKRRDILERIWPATSPVFPWFVSDVALRVAEIHLGCIKDTSTPNEDSNSKTLTVEENVASSPPFLIP